MSETLVPNCLLTKAPILFVAPSRWWGGPDHQLAQYLRDHGYDLIFCRLPRVSFLRRDLLRRLADSKVHVIHAIDAEVDFPEALSLTSYDPQDSNAKSFLLNRMRAVAEQEWSALLGPQEGPEFVLEGNDGPC